MPSVTKVIVTGLTLVMAITSALLSVYVERIGPEQVIYGNLCGPTGFDFCYKPALKGGFPFAYLFDAPGVSRERQLAFGEDELHAGGLITDVAAYFVIFKLIAWVISRRRLKIKLGTK